jgi:Ferritin-like domain
MDREKLAQDTVALLPRASRHTKTLSRRGMLLGSATVGMLGALSIPLIAERANAASEKDQNHDAAILNAAIDLENQAIWAYGVAGDKLSKTQVGETVLALALRNRADHIKHQEALAAVVKSFGKTPSPARSSYDLSTYINEGEGNLDSDANIAKLALALEYDAALAYIDAFNKLKIPAILMAAGTIAPVEAAHVTAIRGVFRTLIPTIEYIPAAFVSAETRKDWILKV